MSEQPFPFDTMLTDPPEASETNEEMVARLQQENFFDAVLADPTMADADKIRWLHATAKDFWERLERDAMTDEAKIQALHEANAILAKALSQARGVFGNFYYLARREKDRRAVVTITEDFARGMCADIDAARAKAAAILRSTAEKPS